MELSPVSWAALAIIVAALAVALSRRFVAWGTLIIANTAVYLLTAFGGVRTGIAGALDPAQQALQLRTVHGELALHLPQLVALQPHGLLTLFSHMFVHQDIWHLLGNMLPLFAFGMPFEERVGPRKVVAIYLATGVIAALTQLAWTFGNADLLMGASGAIFGILGAFAARYPNQVIGVPVPLIVFMMFIRMRVVIGVIIYTAVETFYIIYQATAPNALVSNTAHFAHIGGLAAGLIIGRVLGKTATGPQGPVSVDLALLRPFARDPQTKSVLAHMETNHDEPEVFQAWLDRFFRTATCPTCGHKVLPRPRGVVACTQNHHFDVRKRAAKDAAKAPVKA